MDGWPHGQMQKWTDGWGIFLVLEKVSEAGSLNRARQEAGGEHLREEAVCSGCRGSYRLHRMTCLDGIENTFVI